MAENHLGDRELDAWLAINTMGWELRGSRWCEKGQRKAVSYRWRPLWEQDWHPTTSHDQAFMVAEKVDLFATCNLSKNQAGEWELWTNSEGASPLGAGLIAPLALCRAVKEQARKLREQEG